MICYSRAIQPLIEKALFRGKVIVLYGARQVGKTTYKIRYPSDIETHKVRALNLYIEFPVR